MVEHTDVVEIVKFAKDAECENLVMPVMKSELQVWIEFLQRAVEVLHDLAQHLLDFLPHEPHLERGIIFIDDDHNILTCLLYKHDTQAPSNAH